MTVLEYVEIFLIVLAMFLLGFAVGHYGKKTKYDGTIVISMSEDGEREKMAFILDIELDDIKKKKETIFRVENQLSQNSQAV